MRKAISPLISGVLYTGILIMAISFVLSMVVPAIDNLADTLKVDTSKDMMYSIDLYVNKVASSGKGSKRTIPISFEIGTLNVDTEKNRILFLADVDTRDIAPRTSLYQGNVKISSNANTNLSYFNNSYVLENEHLKVTLFGNGTILQPQYIDFNNIIESIYMKEVEENLTGIGLNVDGLNDAYCWSEAVTGINLGRARVIQHCNSSNLLFDVYIVLESSADYLSVSIKNPSTEYTNVSLVIDSTHISSSVLDSGKIFITSEKSDYVIALVSDSYAVTSSTASSISMTQEFDSNEFYVVFTQGSNQIVRSRLDLVASGKFDLYYDPSFAFKMSDKNHIEFSLDYTNDNINLSGTSLLLRPGNYMLSIENNGSLGNYITILLKTV
ncbi:MAG: hypothetical protein K0B02_00950 [DPANN group archaeon]|nr:hypothetical protein [DPANN group archaeon]